jgi:hypothetical protein
MTLDIVSSRILDRRPWLSQQGIFSYGFTRAASDHPEGDAEIGKRLIAAYRQAIADRPGNPRVADMWTGIVNTWYGELVALVDKGDPVALTTYLRALPRQSAGHGYFQGRVAFDVLAAGNEQQRRALCLMDYLAGMAEAVGVLPVRCQEQTGWDDYSGRSAQEIRSAIEKKIGIPISLPPVFDGLFTLEPEAGPIHLRSLMAVYAMLQLGTLLREFAGIDRSRLRVAEIGAGIGHTAFAARKLGFAGYSLFDIPEVNIAQGYFLLKALSRSEVALYGEEQIGKYASVLPAFVFHSVAADSYHATVNIDSLPEIAQPEAEKYLLTASRCSSWFFSINQESQAMQTSIARQLHVAGLVAANGGYRPVLRVPSWIRAGYVEEMWRVCE